MLNEKSFLVKNYNRKWDGKKVPHNLSGYLSASDREYFDRLKVYVNSERDKGGLPPKKKFLNYIHKQYDGYLKNLFLDMMEEPFFKKELSHKQNIVKHAVTMVGSSSVNIGYLYIVTNPMWKGWSKFGVTTNLDKRLSTYQTGDPDRGYKYYNTWLVESHKFAEIEILNILKKNYKVKGEWILAEPKDVRRIIVSFIKEQKELVKQVSLV